MTVLTVYSDVVLNDLTGAIALLQKLQINLLKSPLDIEVGKDVVNTSLQDGVTNPFQGGMQIIQSQFLLVFSLMAFELFGHVTPKILVRLLELKSTTADALDLRPWPLSLSNQPLSRESQKSMMRDHIRSALKLAKRKASKHKWVTKDVIAYFAAHPDERGDFG